jgi:hypothetical protein
VIESGRGHAAPNGRSAANPTRGSDPETMIDGLMRRPVKALSRHSTSYGTVAMEDRRSKCSGNPLGLCGRRLPQLDLVSIEVIDPGKATVGFIHSFGVDLYALLF